MLFFEIIIALVYSLGCLFNIILSLLYSVYLCIYFSLVVFIYYLSCYLLFILLIYHLPIIISTFAGIPPLVFETFFTAMQTLGDLHSVVVQWGDTVYTITCHNLSLLSLFPTKAVRELRQKNHFCHVLL